MKLDAARRHSHLITCLVSNVVQEEQVSSESTKETYGQEVCSSRQSIDADPIIASRLSGIGRAVRGLFGTSMEEMHGWDAWIY